jgi:hypothetical protein
MLIIRKVHAGEFTISIQGQGDQPDQPRFVTLGFSTHGLQGMSGSIGITDRTALAQVIEALTAVLDIWG